VLHLAEKDPHPVLQKVVWTSVLAPGTFPEYTRLIERSEDAVDSHPKDPVYHRTLGAVLCRASQFDAGIARLNHAMSLAGQQEQLIDSFLLAIAYQQAGHPEDAKRFLDLAEQGIQRAKA